MSVLHKKDIPSEYLEQFGKIFNTRLKARIQPRKAKSLSRSISHCARSHSHSPLARSTQYMATIRPLASSGRLCWTAFSMMSPHESSKSSYDAMSTALSNMRLIPAPVRKKLRAQDHTTRGFPLYHCWRQSNCATLQTQRPSKHFFGGKVAGGGRWCQHLPRGPNPTLLPLLKT